MWQALSEKRLEPIQDTQGRDFLLQSALAYDKYSGESPKNYERDQSEFYLEYCHH